MKLKAIAASVALAAVSATANAAWENGGGVSSPNGELMLTIWNDATETSMSMDLGVSTLDATSLAIGTTFELDQGGLDHISAATAGAGDLQFNLVGSNADQANIVNNPESYSLYATQVAQPTPTFTFATMGGGMLGRVSNYGLQLLNYGSQSATSTEEDPTILMSGGTQYSGFNGYWGTTMGGMTNQGVGVIDSAAVVGDSLYAYSFQLSDIAQQDFTPYAVQSAGYWVVDLESSTLSYVPVPAAVWLFASGVLGLAGVARRRRQA